MGRMPMGRPTGATVKVLKKNGLTGGTKTELKNGLNGCTTVGTNGLIGMNGLTTGLKTTGLLSAFWFRACTARARRWAADSAAQGPGARTTAARAATAAVITGLCQRMVAPQQQ